MYKESENVILESYLKMPEMDEKTARYFKMGITELKRLLSERPGDLDSIQQAYEASILFIMRRYHTNEEFAANPQEIRAYIAQGLADNLLNKEQAKKLSEVLSILTPGGELDREDERPIRKAKMAKYDHYLDIELVTQLRRYREDADYIQAVYINRILKKIYLLEANGRVKVDEIREMISFGSKNELLTEQWAQVLNKRVDLDEAIKHKEDEEEIEIAESNKLGVVATETETPEPKNYDQLLELIMAKYRGDKSYDNYTLIEMIRLASSGSNPAITQEQSTDLFDMLDSINKGTHSLLQPQANEEAEALAWNETQWQTFTEKLNGAKDFIQLADDYFEQAQNRLQTDIDSLRQHAQESVKQKLEAMALAGQLSQKGEEITNLISAVWTRGIFTQAEIVRLINQTRRDFVK